MRVRNLINSCSISRGSRTSASVPVQLQTNHFLPHLSLLCAGAAAASPARTPGLPPDGDCKHASPTAQVGTRGYLEGQEHRSAPLFLGAGSTAAHCVHGAQPLRTHLPRDGDCSGLDSKTGADVWVLL